MDFFKSQETLTTVERILRSIVSFVFLILATKLMGQRSISQLRFLDFIIALTLGNILAHPLSDEKLGLKGSMTTTLVLIVLYVSATWLRLKSLTPADMKLVTPPFNLTRPIIIEGKIDLSLLKEIGKDSTWLEKVIAPAYAEIRDVILATIDENENVRVYSQHDNHSIKDTNMG